jgi:histidinol-phosphatase
VFSGELAFANETADRAAEIAMGVFRGDVRVSMKPDRTPVTQADLAIEAMVRERVAAAFPGDHVIGEEEGGEQASGRVWIVDPIDGTRNFADGIQIWATLLALMVDGEVRLGLASAPALGERYSAMRGRGATMNGEPIHVSEVAAIDDAAILTGDVESWYGTEMDLRLRRLESRGRRRRGFGDFWGHMLVARGSAEVMVEPSLSIWDYAPLVPIVEEAGGRVTQTDGSAPAHGGSLLSTNGRLHAEAVAILAGSQPPA